MSYQSAIDEALEKAKARLNRAGQSHSKEASASADDGLVKQANEIADALEYMAIATAGDGTPAGDARVEMVRNFFKAAAGGGPTEGATTTTGTQKQPPAQSKKTIQPGGSPGATNPEVSDALEGQMAENVMRQMPPATAPTPKSAAATLYDLLMNAKQADHDKEGAGGGPLEMDAEQALPQTPKKNEGKQHADALLGSNTAPVEATKREAKAPTRPRLAEVWEHANDTVGDATAKAVWPQAASKGDMKVAELDDYSQLFTLAISGELGQDAQDWALQIEGSF